ncbi:MAG: hypothetical protein HKN34_09585 [Gammaproteobacteria bacterium]|nr:hypothetical protein [Gammaproteobacteria bacterium]
MDVAVTLEEVGKTPAESETRTGARSGGMNRAFKAKAPNPAVTTQDLQRLMEAFSKEIRLAVPCDGIRYRFDDMDQHFVSGVLDQYLCCFEMKVGQKSFGSIYFARATQFLDSELAILENMVAGLVLLLCQLFQAEISNENIQDSDDNERISVSAAVYNKRV